MHRSNPGPHQEQVILHVDMDAFYASVEQHDHPDLRGRPVVVGSPPDQRGVVSASSYEARRFGIHSAMPSREAHARCPQAVFLPVNMPRYQEVSRQLLTILERYTPVIEPLSIDEAFLDVTGTLHLFGPGPEIAAAIKRTIRTETGLTASVGVASNKFLAKLASDLEKPDGLTVIPTGRDAIMAFLAPLPVGRIWGIGQVMEATLSRHNIHTIGALQNLRERELGAIVGPHAARHLLRLAFGEDARAVEVEQTEKSISREHTFERDCTAPETLRAILTTCAEDVGRRLRQAGLHAGTGHLKLRWQDFKTITRQRRFAHPVCDDITLRRLAFTLLEQEPLVKPVRLVGFGVSSLTAQAPEVQLTLFAPQESAPRRYENLSRSVDAIRRRFGPDSIGHRHPPS